MKARSKYGAKPQVVDGIRFASQKEARRYGELKLLEKAGEIRDIVLQPGFALNTIVVDEFGGMRLVGFYRADFGYLQRDEERNWQSVIEDVKGFRTPLYRWKKKHVEAQYGIAIREI